MQPARWHTKYADTRTYQLELQIEGFRRKLWHVQIKYVWTPEAVFFFFYHQHGLDKGGFTRFLETAGAEECQEMSFF